MSELVKPARTFKTDKLETRVFANRADMGRAAANDAADWIRELLGRQKRVRIVFAAAPSQNEFLAGLVAAEGIDWSRIDAFHMDEYIGLPPEAPQRFSRFLRDRLFDVVNPGSVHLVEGNNGAEEECARYGGLLAEAPIDIVCMGIGENGHIAFNDPPVADFADPHIVKPVELDEECRTQQVNDGCFATFDDVPTHALTLTVPTLMSGRKLFCMVPGPTKRKAVRQTLQGPIGTACPASILRTHPDCVLYVDTDSCEEEI